MNSGYPYLARGMRIGIFGGSFNPPHDGHLLVAERALRRLDLDQIWWVPTHGNPLKANPPAPFGERVSKITAMAKDPKMKVVDVESFAGSRLTIDVINWLLARYANVNFVWVCGSDILDEFHLWDDWQELAEKVPMVAMARPGYQMKALSSPFARRYRRQFVEASDAKALARMDAPAWTLLTGPSLDISSTKLRGE